MGGQVSQKGMADRCKKLEKEKVDTEHTKNQLLRFDLLRPRGHRDAHAFMRFFSWEADEL